MTSKSAVALLVIQLIAAVALAQETTAPAVFSHGSGGEIALLTKQSSRLSGTLGMSWSGLKGFEGTLGGTLIKDRAWFFASASDQPISRTIDTKVNAQLGDRQDFAASFSAARQPLVMSPAITVDSIPSSFLSLRYTGVVSSNLFFTASVSQRSVGP